MYFPELDTGAITGSDAGGKSTKTAENVVPEFGKASYPSKKSFTKHLIEQSYDYSFTDSDATTKKLK